MRLEAIKTPCRCHDKQCVGQRLTQLHLYARNDLDVELLQSLLDLFSENAAEPLQSTDVAVLPETLLPVLDRVQIAATKNS